ncbi:MAG: AlpA family phage regulatory protein [Pseudomonadota bacterium]
MNQILRPKQLSKKLSISPATLWRLQHADDFPKKVQLSARAVGWLQSDIEAWLEKKAAQNQNSSSEVTK